MQKTGSFTLLLHSGPAPRWLLVRMKKLAAAIMKVILSERGEAELLRRLADPLWFQALAHTLAFDWDSSGSTTVTCAVLKRALEEAGVGVAAVGGKGARSLAAPREILRVGKAYGLPGWKVEELTYASRMAAKVDSAAIQAGYQLYHHTMFVGESGEWAVVQQGFNPQTKTARRFHWLSDKARRSFVEEPHSAIVGEASHGRVLDMTSRDSLEGQRASLDLIFEGPRRLREKLLTVKAAAGGQSLLSRWVEAPAAGLDNALRPVDYEYNLGSINWEALEKAYEIRPANYEELLALRGLGPSTVRALALTAQLIYGARVSWLDPIKFTFAFGGKDGVPRPVDRQAMDEAIGFLQGALEAAEVEREEKLRALSRLQRLL